MCTTIIVASLQPEIVDIYECLYLIKSEMEFIFSDAFKVFIDLDLTYVVDLVYVEQVRGYYGFTLLI